MLARSCLVLALVVAPAAAQRALDVRFVDRAGEPVPEVQIRNPQDGQLVATGDANGRVLASLPRQLRSFKVVHEGFAPVEYESYLPRGIDLRLFPPATLVGHVFDRQGAQWSGEWKVCLAHRAEGQAPMQRQEIVILEAGEFRIEDLPATDLHVWVESPLQSPARVTRGLITLEEGAEVHANLVGTRSLRVIPDLPPGPDGSPRIVVRLLDGEEEVGVEQISGTPSPLPVFTGLHAGAYRVEVEAPGCAVLVLDGVKVDEHPDGVPCTLVGLASVRFEVVVAPLLTGAEYMGAGAWMFFGPGVRRVPPSHVLDVVPGQFDLKLNLGDGRHLRVPIDLEQGEELELPLDFDEMVPVSLRVVDLEGQPVQGAQVTLSSFALKAGSSVVQLSLPHAFSDGDGWVDLPPGPVGVPTIVHVDWGTGLRSEHQWVNPGVVELIRPVSGTLRVEQGRAFTAEEQRVVGLRTSALDQLFLTIVGSGRTAVEKVQTLPFTVEATAGTASLFAQRWSRGGSRTYALVVGTVEVKADQEAVLVVDPARQHAGQLCVETTVDGEALESSAVRIHAPADWPHPWQCFEGGPGERVAFPPSGRRRLRVSGLDGTWAAILEVDVGLREIKQFRVDVDRVAREVRFLGPDGSPLIEKRILFERELLGLELQGDLLTDEDGRVFVRMVPGEVSFRAIDHDPHLLQWGTDTEPLEIRFQEDG